VGEVDILGRRAAEAPGVEADGPIAGIDEEGHDGIPRPEVGDPGVEEDDRRALALGAGVELAPGDGDGDGRGRHRPILAAGSG
jgi:hypothetical protein